MAPEEGTEQQVATESTIRTLDDLHGEESNPEEEARQRGADLLDDGTYHTIPSLSAVIGTTKEGPNAGRETIRYFGSVVGIKEVAGKEGKIPFTMSSEFRLNAKGKNDLQTKLWLGAVKAYRTATGIDPKVPVDKGAVAKFVRDYSVAIRVGKNQDGDENMVWSITNVKE